MGKVFSFGSSFNRGKTWNLTSEEPLTPEEIEKATASLSGMKIEINPMLSKDTIMIASSKDAVVKVFNFSNRKVLFKLGRFELAYYKKEEEK